MSTLDAAPAQFETVEANLTKLDKLWQRISGLLPDGSSPYHPANYDDACFAFRRILAQMPTIDGFGLADELLDYDAAGQMHSDALEVDELEIHARFPACSGNRADASPSIAAASVRNDESSFETAFSFSSN